MLQNAFKRAQKKVDETQTSLKKNKWAGIKDPRLFPRLPPGDEGARMLMSMGQQERSAAVEVLSSRFQSQT